MNWNITFSPPPPFSEAQLRSWLLCLPCKWDGEWGFGVSTQHSPQPLLPPRAFYPSPAWVLPTGCSPLQTALAWVLSMDWSPSGNICSNMCPPQAADSFMAHPPAPAWGWSVSICSNVVLHGLQGDTCIAMVSPWTCRGISAPASGAPLPSPSPLTLRFVWFFSHTFFLTPISAVQHFALS